MPSIDYALNKDFLRANVDELPSKPEREGALFLSIDIEPGTADKGKAEENTANVVLLFDSSGSMMAEDKLEVAKEAAKEFIDSIPNIDNISVISFSEESEVVCRGSGKSNDRSEDIVADDKAEMASKIENIEARGGTALHQALKDAEEEILKSDVPEDERVDRVILLSDGKPTIGNTSEEVFKELAKDFASQDISITCGGIGDDYSEDILIALAENSRNGKWRHLKDTEDIKELFKREADRIKETTMIKPDLKITPVQGVELGMIYQAEPEVSECRDFDIQDGTYNIPIGDLIQGEKQTYVVQIYYPKRPPGECRLAQLQLAGEDAKDIVVTYLDEEDKYTGEVNERPRHLFMTARASLDGRDVIDGEDSKMDTVVKMTTEIIEESSDDELVDRATQIKETVMDKDTVVLSEEEKKEKKGSLSTTVIKED